MQNELWKWDVNMGTGVGRPASAHLTVAGIMHRVGGLSLCTPSHSVRHLPDERGGRRMPAGAREGWRRAASWLTCLAGGSALRPASLPELDPGLRYRRSAVSEPGVPLQGYDLLLLARGLVPSRPCTDWLLRRVHHWGGLWSLLASK